MNKDKKVLIRFVLILIVCALVGGVSGYFMASAEQSASALLGAVMQLIGKLCTPLCFASALVLVYGIVTYYKGVKLMEASLNDMDNEDLLNQADSTLNIATTCISQSPLLTMIFYGVTMPGCLQPMDLTPWPVFLAQTVVFILVLIGSTVYQVKAVDAVKKLYPEKQGNVLDFKFADEWLKSCDEAERQTIGEASYYSYKMTSVVCIALLVVSIFVSSTLQLGPFPTLAIGILMMTSTFSYLYKCYLIEKGRK